MDQPAALLPNMKTALQQNLGDRLGNFLIPPPVFFTLKGQFLEFNQAEVSLSSKFPVLSGYLNPFGQLQGGMISALIDNTIGPLSVLIAPPSVTRSLEITYSSPVTPKLGHVIVLAQLLEQLDEHLIFKAVVRSPSGKKLARARASHFILPTEGHYA